MTRFTRWLSVLMLWPLAAFSAPAVVQHCINQAVGFTSVTVSTCGTVSASDKIYLFFTATLQTATVTFSDSSSDTATTDYAYTSASAYSTDYAGIAIAEIDAPTAGSLTFTASSTAAGRLTLMVVEVSGTGAMDVVGTLADAAATANTSTATANNITTTAANDIVFSVVSVTPNLLASSLTWAATVGGSSNTITQLDATTGSPTGADAYLLAGSAASVGSNVAITMTNTSWGWAIIQIAFKASGGAPNPPASQMLMGAVDPSIIRAPAFATFLPAAWVIERRNALRKRG